MTPENYMESSMNDALGSALRSHLCFLGPFTNPQPNHRALAAILAIFVSVAFTPHSAQAANSATALTLESSSTPTCIGFKWFIGGDDDLDASVTVQYRLAGATTWLQAQPLLRVEPGTYNDYEVDPGNLLAGSIFKLEPDRNYDARLTLSDPDGGQSVKNVVVHTRAIPSDPVQPRIRYVRTGTGGGSGTSSDPFRGIAAANASAAPGDIFLLQPGTYTGVATLNRSGTESNPIVWRGTNVDTVILDGQGTAKPVVDFPSVSHVHLENVTIIRPKQMAIRGTATSSVAVRGCKIDSSNLTGSEKGGIYFLGADQENVFITDNEIKGPFNWEDGRNDDAYGLIISGTGHVIRYNEIYDWWDGMLIGHGETEVETSNCDIYGNEIYNCTDDAVETDGSRHNIRIFENRITNVLCGISAQPIFGGPMYAIHNVIYNHQLKPLKYQLWPTGLIVFGNTFVGADPRGWGEGQWRNAIVRNNLFIGGSERGHEGDPIALDTSGIRADMDYNGWYQAVLGRFGRFNGILYPTLLAFQVALGMGQHDVLLDIGVFVDAEEPPMGPYLGDGGYPPPYEPGSQDLRLRTGSLAQNRGVYLANINNGYTGTAPDLGAYEIGKPLPQYGPGGSDPSSAPSAVAGAVASMEVWPNPFRDQSRITFDSPSAELATLQIFSASGRLLRTLDSSTADSDGSVMWDGRDDTGRPLATGVYWIRLYDSVSAGRALAQRKVVKLN